MRVIGWAILLLMGVAGCIEPFPVRSTTNEVAVVVDGMITDQPGPYTVKLSRSGSPVDVESISSMISGASVWIVDGGGRAVSLKETASGIYSSDPDELRGEVGGTYSLKIVMKDGTEFQSTAETLFPAGNIDSLYAVYEENSINQTDQSLPQDAITFFVDGRSDAQNDNGYLRWRSTTIYEILTYPELRTVMSEAGPIPAPLPCSGYINDNNRLRLIDTCSCCNCWIYEYPRNAVVSPNLFASQNAYKRVAVAQVPVDRWRFFRKYYFEMEQLSVSENVFRFWKGVSAQQQGTGSLFQPNAVKVKGNVRCVSNSDTEVFGVFAACGITRQSMFITRTQLPKALAPPDTVSFDCRYVIEHADNVDNIKPPFW